LLLVGRVNTEAQDIVRAIRRGLGMTQAEFAQALGWSTSTISKWESGKAEPNRLALKIILAYGEERRVRYRPRRPTVPTLPVPIEHRTAAPPIVVESTATPRALPPPWSAEARLDHPRWEAAFTVRVARGPHDPGERTGWFRNTAVVTGAVCVALAIGIPLLGRPASHAAVHRHVVAAAPRPPRFHRHAAWTDDAPSEPVAVPAPAPLPVSALLEGITVLGTQRHATFRTPDETITLTEGATLGSRRAAHIGADGVQLVDASGETRLVRVGGQIPVD